MPITFLLLQVANVLLAVASLWIHFRNPFLWAEQAIVLSAFAGAFIASFTALLLGFFLVFANDAKLRSVVIHLLLTLAFAALQGYLVFLTSRDMGILNLLKSKLG